MRQNLLVPMLGALAGSLLWTATASAATVSLEYEDEGVGLSFTVLPADWRQAMRTSPSSRLPRRKFPGPCLARHFHDRRKLEWGTRK